MINIHHSIEKLWMQPSFTRHMGQRTHVLGKTIMVDQPGRCDQRSSTGLSVTDGYFTVVLLGLADSQRRQRALAPLPVRWNVAWVAREYAVAARERTVGKG